MSGPSAKSQRSKGKIIRWMSLVFCRYSVEKGAERFDIYMKSIQNHKKDHKTVCKCGQGSENMIGDQQLHRKGTQLSKMGKKINQNQQSYPNTMLTERTYKMAKATKAPPKRSFAERYWFFEKQMFKIPLKRDRQIFLISIPSYVQNMRHNNS